MRTSHRTCSPPPTAPAHHLPPPLTTSYPLLTLSQIAYKDIKYNFQVQRTSADVYTFTINGGSFEAKVRESPDGSLLVEYDGMTSKIVGFEEPLGLRVIIDGTTCLLP